MAPLGRCCRLLPPQHAAALCLAHQALRWLPGSGEMGTVVEVASLALLLVSHPRDPWRGCGWLEDASPLFDCITGGDVGSLVPLHFSSLAPSKPAESPADCAGCKQLRSRANFYRHAVHFVGRVRLMTVSWLASQGLRKPTTAPNAA